MADSVAAAPAAPAAHAAGARPVGASAAATAMPVGASGSPPRAAITAAPTDALSPGWRGDHRDPKFLGKSFA